MENSLWQPMMRKAKKLKRIDDSLVTCIACIAPCHLCLTQDSEAHSEGSTSAPSGRNDIYYTSICQYDLLVHSNRSDSILTRVTHLNDPIRTQDSCDSGSDLTRAIDKQ